MALTANINLSVTGNQTSVLDLGTVTLPYALSFSDSLASGVAADMADMVWTDTRTLSASATEDLDLAAVLINHISGAAMTFVKIKGLFITAAAANTNNVVLTRPASNGVPLFLAAADGIPILPGGFFAWFAPNLAAIAVTAGTGDLLTLTNSAGSTGVTYSIVILGASA